MGDGNLNLMSISPVAISHTSTFQSVDELMSLAPLRFQLHTYTHTQIISHTFTHPIKCIVSTNLSDVIGWVWQLQMRAIPLVMKSHMAMRPSLHPTANCVPLLLKEQVRASLPESKIPSLCCFEDNDHNGISLIRSKDTTSKINNLCLTRPSFPPSPPPAGLGKGSACKTNHGRSCWNIRHLDN